MSNDNVMKGKIYRIKDGNRSTNKYNELVFNCP